MKGLISIIVTAYSSNIETWHTAFRNCICQLYSTILITWSSFIGIYTLFLFTYIICYVILIVTAIYFLIHKFNHFLLCLPTLGNNTHPASALHAVVAACMVHSIKYLTSLLLSAISLNLYSVPAYRSKNISIDTNCDNASEISNSECDVRQY